jgi:hypothetical protein
MATVIVVRIFVKTSARAAGTTLGRIGGTKASTIYKTMDATTGPTRKAKSISTATRLATFLHSTWNGRVS